MTMTTSTPAESGDAPGAEDMVSVTIDGVDVQVPKDTLVIRAAELIGVEIPRFCDHPLLEPVGACRQCLVEVPDAGNGRALPKPQASCTLLVADGMVVNTQVTSPVADKAQQGNMEFLLINHPLDCPVCDKGGECPLQNQAMSHGRGESRFVETKRTYAKPINISAQVLLDRERCVLCARCTRFSEQIAGDPFIALVERGSLQQVGIYEREPFESYFSGNTIQICPVGALTSAAYRFRARPFDLVSTPSICEHCASGCALRVDHRRGRVMRRLAGDDPQVNEEWNCDKGRFGFGWTRQPDRLTTPLVRDEETRQLRPASWIEAFVVTARGLAKARGRTGVLTGGRLTAEDAYAYAKFARVALHTNDIDFRARSSSAEEAEFLASSVVATQGVTYADLESASAVLLVGFEPEDESPIIFLRLRKAMRKHSTRVVSVASHTSRGLAKLGGRLVRTPPGGEAQVLTALAEDAELALDGGGVILVGERLAAVPGGLSAALRLAATTGARLAWVPRRAGERGALEAGCLPALLPGGRPVADPSARADAAAAWGVRDLPTAPGRDSAAILAAWRSRGARRTGRGGRRPDRPARHGDRTGRCGGDPVRGQPGGTGECRQRTCRRRAARCRGGGEVRHVRGLGRAGATLPGRAAGDRDPARPARAVRHRRGDGNAAGLPHCRAGARGHDRPRRLGRPAGARADRARRPPRAGACWKCGARHLAPAHRRRTPARRRSLSGRNGPPRGGPAVARYGVDARPARW
jgi:NADH-quinone oxidoreductase subunit G